MKKLLSILIILATTATLCVMPVSAADMMWQSDADITALLSGLDIMVGDDDGNFQLDSYVTRAQMSKIAVAASSYKNTVAVGLQFSPFSDVKGTYWGAPYIRAAVSAGIVEGYIDGTFLPDAYVTYEEAITMMLRVLGYTDDDFGASYPYGQIGTAQGLKLTEGLDAQVGDNLTRRDTAKLVCNALEAKSKATGKELISVHDCSFVNDVTVIASQIDDNTLGSDEISTSAGKYRVESTFNDSYVGSKGDMVLRDGKYVVAFSSEGSQKSDKFVVYTTLNDAILCYPYGNNTTVKQFKLNSSTVCYNNSIASTYGAMRSQMEMGDTVRVRYNDSGEVDYISYSEGMIDGPVKAVSSDWLGSFATDSNTKIVRDGKQTDKSAIEINDILYFSKNLNMVMAYSRKVTGVYEDAIPSKDTPKQVVISGVTYEVEGAEAFNDLSSNGTLSIGDTITVLMGRDGEQVAGVVTSSGPAASAASVTGYITGSGKKTFNKGDGTTYVSYYINLVTPDGTVYTYPTDYDKSSAVNTVSRVTVKDGKATVGTTPSGGGVYGTVSYSGKSIGSKKVADNVEIIDVAKNPYSDTPLYAKTYMQRLDGISLTNAQVLYYGTNSAGEINELILSNATGDMYSYGMVTSVTKASMGEDGKTNVATIESGNGTYTLTGFGALTVGTPVRFIKDGNSAVYAASLSTVSGTVSSLTQGYAVINGKEYRLSDKVKTYKKSGQKYMEISLNDAISGDYSYVCYRDKAEDLGGRIYVVIAKEK